MDKKLKSLSFIEHKKSRYIKRRKKTKEKTTKEVKNQTKRRKKKKKLGVATTPIVILIYFAYLLLKWNLVEISFISSSSMYLKFFFHKI